MGFRFQRRINLGGGWGLNTGRSGGSLSYRSRQGSIGTKGFSLRTGLPGLSYRQRWGKNAGFAALVVLAFMVALAVVAVSIRILVYVVPLIWNTLKWVLLTVYDLCAYGVEKVQIWRSSSVGSRYSIARDALIGAAVCGVVWLLFLYFRGTPDAPAPEPSTAATSNNDVPKKYSETAVAGSVKTTHPRKVNTPHSIVSRAKQESSVNETIVPPPSSAQLPVSDDLAEVRAVDTTAADRIKTYCESATAQATARQTEILARCRHDEAAAWERLEVQNEFPLLNPAIRKTCTSPPFPASFVAEEVCVKYESNSDSAH